VSGWIQIEGMLHVVAARNGDEDGSFLWIGAGELREALTAELFLPAVASDRLDGAMGVAVGSIRGVDGERTGHVKLQFGRVDDGRGVVSATGDGIDADISFELRLHPPSGGFCAHCGAERTVDVMSVITPPDGGVICAPASPCAECGR
jgi:hypothetical protein